MADEFTKAALYGIKTFNKKVKEKIGMEKLIELLNEYEPYIASDGEHRDNLWGYAYQGHSAVFPKEIAESYIISKSYGFIKWLVENDKIDQKGIEYKFQDVLFELEEEEIVKEKSDFLIMLLSISSTPIEDLVSYLK